MVRVDDLFALLCLIIGTASILHWEGTAPLWVGTLGITWIAFILSLFILRRRRKHG